MNEDVKIPEVGYTTPEPDRWQKAAKAATEALDAAQAAGYELYNLDGDPSKRAGSDQRSLSEISVRGFLSRISVHEDNIVVAINPIVRYLIYSFIILLIKM